MGKKETMAEEVIEETTEETTEETETVETTDSVTEETAKETTAETEETVPNGDVVAAEDNPTPKPVRRKKKQLRLWVRILLAAIAALIAFLLFMYIMGGAVLQESYKLTPPTPEEVASAKANPGIYNWLVTAYDQHQ